MARRSLSLVAASAVLFGALTASAQESRPERPYRGLFASGTSESQQVLSVSGSVASGYDTSVLAGESEAGLTFGSGVLQSDGSMYNQYVGGLAYTASLDTFAFGASLSSSARQYPLLDLSTTMSHAASTGLTARLGRSKKTTVGGGAAVTYQSIRGFLPFPELADPSLGQIAAPGQDFGADRSKYYRYTTTAEISRQLSKRAAFTASYSRQNSQFANGSEDLNQQTGWFRFTRGITRNLGLRLGYGLTQADYQIDGRGYQSHNLDMGVDYSRDLSLTRRTTLSFATGAAAVRQDQYTRYDAVGSAVLNREIGRSWTAAVTYKRNVGFIESVREPIFYDGVSASFGGMINRRLSFQSGTGATIGNVGMVQTASGNGFNAWTTFAGINAAITRNLAVGVNYTFYRYNFDQGAALSTGLLSLVNRHSINVTLNAWVPLLQRGRKTNATR